MPLSLSIVNPTYAVSGLDRQKNKQQFRPMPDESIAYVKSRQDSIGRHQAKTSVFFTYCEKASGFLQDFLANALNYLMAKGVGMGLALRVCPSEV